MPDSSGVLSTAAVGTDFVVSVDLTDAATDLMDAAVEGAREGEGLVLSSLGVDIVRVQLKVRILEIESFFSAGLHRELSRVRC